MSYREFDVDPEKLIREVFVPSADGKQFDIVTQQDVEPVLAENRAQRIAAPKRQFNNPDSQSGLTKVASIPNVVMVDLREKGILADPERFKHWLNDPDNVVFRTREGKI